MGKSKDVYSLEGELVQGLDSTRSYFKTRARITEVLLNFIVGGTEEEKDGKKVIVGGKNMVKWVGGCKIEDKKFTIPVRITPNVFSSMTDGLKHEQQVALLGTKLEEAFNIATATPSKEVEEELVKNGIVPISHVTNFEQKSFEED